MKKEDYIEKMQEHHNAFNEIWTKIVQDTNQFVEDNSDIKTDSLKQVENIIDDFCLSGAWIQDRINGKSGLPQTSKYRGSLTKKIRKALGYTY